MSRWIALHCGDEAEALQAQHPNAFLLLCQIARRAKWKDCRITKMQKGEALIGDWKEAGIRSQMAYRIAKQTLADCGLATFQGTNKGTRAILASTTIFSLTSHHYNDPENETGNDPATIQQRPGNDPATTNHTDTRNTQTTLIHPEGETPKPPKKFQKPTLEEVTAYALTLKPPGIDAGKFLDHYTANGWKVGKNPMKDWQSAVRNWHRGDNAKPTATAKPILDIDTGGRKPNLDLMRKLYPDSFKSDPAPTVDMIVQAYPRRENVAQAAEAIRASIRRGEIPEVILSGTRAIAAVIPTLPSAHLNAYVPSASSFFKNERWKDDPQTWKRQGNSKTGAVVGKLDLGGRKAEPITQELIDSWDNPGTGHD